MKTLTHISANEQKRIIEAVRNAGQTIAILWDILRQHENDSGEFDGTMHMVEAIAAGFNSPPQSSDIPDELIWESIVDCWIEL